MIFFDAHCDTIQKLTDFGGELSENEYHLDLSRLEAVGENYVQVFAAFIDRNESLFTPFERCSRLIETYYNQIFLNRNRICHCNGYDDICSALQERKTASLLSIEGGEALEGNLDNLKYFYDQGVRLMTITWNYDNELCGGIENNNSGLTAFGENVVDEMNNLGMITDVSHLSEKGFWDVAERTKLPITATHSNARTVCDHKRNLSDEQICAIIKSGGCIGINMFSEFISENECTINDVIRHIEHILSLGGENNIGLGCDFDGMNKLPQGINGVEDIGCLFDEMRHLGYAELLIKKISSGNFLKLMKKILY